MLFRRLQTENLRHNALETGKFGTKYCSCLLLTLCMIVPSVLWCYWLGGRKGIRHVKIGWWGAGICLGRGADLHIAQLILLPPTVSCFSKSRLVLPSWYQLTRVVLDRGPLNGCCCFFVHDKCCILWDTGPEKVFISTLIFCNAYEKHKAFMSFWCEQCVNNWYRLSLLCHWFNLLQAGIFSDLGNEGWRHCRSCEIPQDSHQVAGITTFSLLSCRGKSKGSIFIQHHFTVP